MNRLSAHVGYLYTELPLVDRLAAAARDGFSAVEHPEPHPIPAAEMRMRLKDLNLAFTQITSGMGDKVRGEKGLAALPGREADFRAGLERALDYALVVGCPFLHPMAGVPEPGTDPARAEAIYHENIAWALDCCVGTGVRLLVEAITVPGYAMAALTDAIALQDASDGRLKLLLDSYHAAALGLDASEWAAANAARIGHVHIADHPGRHEPGTGRINFPRLLAALRDAGYAGAIGFEYVPSRETADSLRFLAGWRRRLDSPVLSGASS